MDLLQYIGVKKKDHEGEYIPFSLHYTYTKLPTMAISTC